MSRLMVHVGSIAKERARRLFKKAVQHGRSERRGVPLGYVEPLSEARTPLADVYSIPLMTRPIVSVHCNLLGCLAVFELLHHTGHLLLNFRRRIFQRCADFINNPGRLLGLVIPGRNTIRRSQDAQNNKYDSCDTHPSIPLNRDHTILPLLCDQHTTFPKESNTRHPFGNNSI